jgi:hypothetical protein
MNDLCDDPVLDRSQIAAELRVSLAMASNLMNRKAKTRTPFPYFCVGSRKLTRLSWLHRWIEENREQ